MFAHSLKLKCSTLTNSEKAALRERMRQRKEKTRSDLNRDATRVELHKARLARQSAEAEARECEIVGPALGCPANVGEHELLTRMTFDAPGNDHIQQIPEVAKLLVTSFPVVVANTLLYTLRGTSG